MVEGAAIVEDEMKIKRVRRSESGKHGCREEKRERGDG